MKIKLMTIDDYEGAYALWLNTTGMGINSIDDSKEGINKYLLRNPNTCFVAYDHIKLVGVILCGHDGRRGFIYHMAVHESVRKMGIGRKLLNKSIMALQCEGIVKIACMVFTDNNRGNRFWDSVGINPRNDIIYRDKMIINAQQVDAPEPATMVTPASQTLHWPAR